MYAGQSRIGVIPRETDGVMVVRLRGEIDLGSAPSAAVALRSGAAAEVPASQPVVLDLTGVDFLSAAGVHMLHGFALECADRGVCTRLLVKADGIVERVTQLADLQPHIPVFTVLGEALVG